MISILKNWLKKRILDPDISAILYNPYYLIKKTLISALRRNAHHIKGKALDFGCGNRNYEHLFNSESVTGLDILQSGHDHTGENIDVFYNGKIIPFDNNTFDSIYSIEVFEHIFNLDEILGELHRVLKPGGKLLISIPFVWEEYEKPYDFGRYTSFGIKHLLEKHNFKTINIDKTSGFIETIFQLWNLFIFKKLFPKIKLLQLATIPIFIFPTNLLAVLLTFLLPKRTDIFLGMVIVAEKK